MAGYAAFSGTKVDPAQVNFPPDADVLLHAFAALRLNDEHQ